MILQMKIIILQNRVIIINEAKDNDYDKDNDRRTDPYSNGSNDTPNEDINSVGE